MNEKSERFPRTLKPRSWLATTSHRLAAGSYFGDPRSAYRAAGRLLEARASLAELVGS
jgi:hypothetical protein